MKQNITNQKNKVLLEGSVKTSRNQVPSLHRKIARDLRYGSFNFDIGGGKFEKASQFLKQYGVCNIVYDPFARTEAYNKSALNFIKWNKPDTATIANVLCVIPYLSKRKEIYKLASVAGVAYFSIYERTKDGIPTITRDGYQANKPIEDYLPEINVFFKKTELIRISGVKIIKAYNCIHI